MLYLLYLRNGFIKKTPLNKDSISLGRTSANDLQIDEVFVSKEHAKLIIKKDSIEIFDLNSTNGIFTRKGKTNNEIISLNQYFRIGKIKFYLKIGKANDFTISEKIQQNPNKIINHQLFDGDKTIEVSDLESLFKDNKSTKSGKDLKYLNIITVNPELNNLIAQSKKIATSNLSILIEGDTGTGKELLAKFIHYNSINDKNKLIALNCSAIPENLMEAELFGHERGAFTDASMQKKGKLELASEGTLILDEIGDMPLNLQAKLLRAIQEEQFYRLGGTSPIKVKLRIISMTNKNISKLIDNNVFRNDLYYRIAHIVLKIPPLCERKEDVVPLINHFIEKHSTSVKTIIKGFSNETIRALETYNWPGNIRELENEILKLLNLAENNDVIDFNMLKNEIKQFYKKTEPVDTTSLDEKQLILELLEVNKWNKSIVAEKMKISRTALYNKLKKYSINL